jgi:hypothetical protein
VTLENIRHRLPSGTIGEGAVDQNNSLDGRERRRSCRDGGAREERQNQVSHGGPPFHSDIACDRFERLIADTSLSLPSVAHRIMSARVQSAATPEYG